MVLMKVNMKQNRATEGQGGRTPIKRQDKQPVAAQVPGSSSYVCWRELMSCVSEKYVENLCLFLSSRSGLS